MIKAILNKTPTKIDERPRNKPTNKNGITSIKVFLSKIKSFRIKLSILPTHFFRIKHNVLKSRLLNYSHFPKVIFCTRFVGSQCLKAAIRFSNRYNFLFRIGVKQLQSTFNNGILFFNLIKFPCENMPSIMNERDVIGNPIQA